MENNLYNNEISFPLGSKFIFLIFNGGDFAVICRCPIYK